MTGTCCETRECARSEAPKNFTFGISKKDSKAGDYNDADEDMAKCLALIQTKENQVAILDRTRQEPRHFVYKDGPVSQLCFSDHGHNVADLLTYFFDDEGNHGTPDESCFCGLEEPHFHAHLYDPKTCCGSHLKHDRNKSIESLSTATLFLKPEEEHHLEIPQSLLPQARCTPSKPPATFWNESEFLAPIANKAVQDNLVYDRRSGDCYLQHPCGDCCEESDMLSCCQGSAECCVPGELDYHGRLAFSGYRHWSNEETGGNYVSLHFFRDDDQPQFVTKEIVVPKPDGGCCKENACCGSDAMIADEEFDSLSVVEDEKSACCKSGSDSGCCKENACCGSDAMMADEEFDSISVVEVEKSPCCKSRAICSTETVNVPDTMNVYEEPAGCDCCVESGCKDSVCGDGRCSDEGSCCCNSQALHVDNNLQGDKSQVIRSTFVCSKICCSSEVPMIQDVLEEVPGVGKVLVNVPMKQVLVDHESKISAIHLNDLLNKNHFGSSIQRDGLDDLVASKPSGVVRSTLFVEKICCASEIPAIRSIVEPLIGVVDLKINVTSKLVYVDHKADEITAADVCDALNADLFGARVEKDGELDALNEASTIVSSTFLVDAKSDTRLNAVHTLLKSFDKDQVDSFRVDDATKRIHMRHNPLILSAEDVANAINEKLDIVATIETDGKDDHMWNFVELDEETSKDTASRMEAAKIRPTVVVSGLCWLVSMLSLIGGNWEFLKYVGLVSVVFGLPPIAMKAMMTLRRGLFDANCLMTFASIGAVALQEFTEAAAVTFLFAASEWLEERATFRARQALASIIDLCPERANLIHPQTGQVVVVPVKSVPLGALVSVRAGDKVPCDGLIVEGKTIVDESSLTGESRPVQKASGDKVSGGTINSGNSQVTVKTTATADDSAVAKLIRLVEEAQANRSETEKMVDNFAKVYTPLVVLVSLSMVTIPWAWGREIGAKWTELGLVVAVIACPCALIISTPVSYVAGLAALAQKGILVRGGAYLESLGKVGEICFDKTGTLTKGVFELTHFIVLGGGRAQQEILNYLLMIEERASHPLARALVDGAKNKGATTQNNLFVREHSFLPGEGIVGFIGEDEVYVGNVRLFKRLGYSNSLNELVSKQIAEWDQFGTVGLMSIGDEIVCAYCVADTVRTESTAVISELRAMGIRSTMLTGDNKNTATSIGNTVDLGADYIKSELLPKHKLEFVSQLKVDLSNPPFLRSLFTGKKTVMMCGDGVNDAPALATADIGVAMGEGAALAMETADVTLLDSNLNKLLDSIKMGRKVVLKIQENITFSIVVKILVLGFALAGKAALWAAIASDVGAMILVTLNSMSLIPSRRIGTNRTESAAKEKDVLSKEISV